MDASLLGCVAVRNARLSPKQINLLRVSGKDIVMIPDMKKGEWGEFVSTAQEHNWYVSVPDWGGKANPDPLRTTDIGQSVQKNGLLLDPLLMDKWMEAMLFLLETQQAVLLWWITISMARLNATMSRLRKQVKTQYVLTFWAKRLVKAMSWQQELFD